MLSISRVVELNALPSFERVVVSSALFSCASDSVVMSENAQLVKNFVLCFNHFVNLLLGSLLVDCSKTVHLSGSMELVRKFTDVGFVVWSCSEVSCPELVRVICVRHHVVVLCGPFQVVAVNCLHVVAWS